MFSIIKRNILEPFLSCKLNYLPIIIIYFCAGFVSLTAISSTFWIKEKLDLTPAELIHIGFWASAPWSMKILFSQFVENIAISGNHRKSYLLIGAILTISGSFILISYVNNYFAILNSAYYALLISGFLISSGVVLQDIIADTLCAEVVTDDVNVELQKVEISNIQILGRISQLLANIIGLGIGAYLAQNYNFEKIVWASLIPPILSIFSTLNLKIRGYNEGKFNYYTLLIGFAMILVAIITEIFNIPFNQEIIFVINLTLVIVLLKFLNKDREQKTCKEIALIGIMIFCSRINPTLGAGVSWWQIDVLGFDQSFLSILAQINNLVLFLFTILFSGYLVKKDIGFVLGVPTIISVILSIPTIGMAFGLHEWTQTHFRFGARTIALIDATIDISHLALIMPSLGAFTVFYAPQKHKLMWFSLTACFMNISLLAGDIVGKLLNKIFLVERGHYEQVGNLMIAKVIIVLTLTIGSITICNRYRKAIK